MKDQELQGCVVKFRLGDILRDLVVSKCTECAQVWLGKIPNKRCPVCHQGDIVVKTGMTQVEASQLTNLSRQALIKLVREPQSVKMTTLSKLCAGLELTPKMLFEMES